VITAATSQVRASSGERSLEEVSTIEGELYVKDAHKSFGVTKALNGVSFRAHFGEIHAIVGGNGCGKSTLAKVVSGVTSVDKGKVSVLGHAPRSPAEARALGVATVFQEVMVAEEASIAENLFAGSDGLWSRKISTREKLTQARVLMRELTGTDIDPERLAAGLSLGVKAWIAIGRALLCRPKVLILDESSAALDFDSTERLFGKMRELRDRGAAVLIVTHRIAELVRISDRATVMRDGRNVGVLQKSEITEKNLLGLMTGRNESHNASGAKAAVVAGGQAVLRTTDMQVWPNAENVNFELRKGEIVGVTGLEGHGQDAFVRILAGVAAAERSFPTVQDSTSSRRVEIRSLEEAKKRGIAFVSGDRKREGILPNMSIFENLLIAMYGSYSRGGKVGLINWSELSGIFDYEVERLSIKTGPKTNLITSLSGGNQQKVLIGRAFATQPKILVLNDPARGIDAGAKQELYRHLRDFVAEGNSVVYMSSELEEFIGLCPRVVVFRHGSIFDTFVGDEVEPVGILEGMFGQSRSAGSSAHRRSAGVRTAAGHHSPSDSSVGTHRR
jgi:ribose transport system ATP-binding protein